MTDSQPTSVIDLRWIVIALFAITGIAYPRLSTTKGPAGDSSGGTRRNTAAHTDKENEDSSKALAEKTAFGLVREFLALPATRRSASLDDGLRIDHDLARGIKQGNVEIRCLIATVPDPVESHLQSGFDDALSAVQLACQQYGYLLDRYYLPWKQWLQIKDRPTVGDTVYERHPGVLLFRQHNIDKSNNRTKPPEHPIRILLVLLVGETPIGGVHRQAFLEALETARAAHPFGPKSTKGTFDKSERRLHVLGPYNSGTSSSIRLVLEEWHRKLASPKPTVSVKLISGSAADYDNRARLTTPIMESSRRVLQVEFAATVTPVQSRLDVIYGYLRDSLHLKESQILMVNEFSTPYGRAIGRPTRAVLPYPLEVGQLRNAYEQDPALKFGPTAVGADRPTTGLHVPLGEPPYASDVPPSFSAMSPATTELQLATIFQTIAKDDVRAVGISGIDVRDIVFVVKQLRRNCPDVQIFGVDSDVLYTHPDFIDVFEGMLIAVTYPLMLESQSWHAKDNSSFRVQFNTNVSEGVYNAAIALLNDLHVSDCPKPLLDYATPMSTDSSQARSCDNLNAAPASTCSSTSTPCAQRTPATGKIVNRPPLWLMSVGRDGFSPLAVFTKYQGYDYVYAEKSASCPCASGTTNPIVDALIRAGLPGTSHLLAAALLCILAGVVLAAFNRHLIWKYSWTALSTAIGTIVADPLRKTSKDALFWCKLPGTTPENESSEAVIRWYALIFFVALLTILLLLAIAPLMMASALALQMLPARGCAIGCAVVAWALMVAADWVIPRFFADEPTNGGPPFFKMSRLVAVFFGAALAFAVVQLAVFCETRADWVAWLALALLISSSSALLFVVYNLNAYLYAAPRLRGVLYLLPFMLWDAILLAIPTVAAFWGWIPACILLVVIILVDWVRSLLMNRSSQAVRSLSGILLALPWRLVPAAIMLVLTIQYLWNNYQTAPNVSCNNWCTVPVSLRLALAGQRLSAFSSGVTPIAPMVLLAMIICFWAVCHLRRQFAAATYRAGKILDSPDPRIAGLREAALQIQDRLEDVTIRRLWIRDVVFFVVGTALLLYIWYRGVPMPEGIAVDWLLTVLIFLGFLVVAGLQIRVRLVCSLLRDFLRRLDGHPLARSLDGIPDQMKNRAASHLLARPQELSDASIMVHKLQVIARQVAQDKRVPAFVVEQMESEASTLTRLYSEFVDSLEKQLDDREERRSKLFGRLSDVASKLLPRLHSLWLLTPEERTDLAKMPSGGLLDAEQFVGMQLAMYLNETFAQIRDLLGFLLVTLLLFLWALNSYPFQPGQMISVFCSVLVVWIVASMVVIFVGFSRSGVLSRLSGTPEHRMTWDRSFIVSLVLYGVIPLLGLLATQFPEFSNVLFKWTDVLQQAFRS